VNRIYLGDRFDVDLPVKIEGEIGQAPGGGAKIGGALKGLVKQRGGDFGTTEARSVRAMFGRKLDSRAHLADVRVVEELIGRQRDRDAADVSFAAAGAKDSVDGRMPKPVKAAS
jgi:hypothetical protein